MTSIYMGPPLKAQPQHSAADLARVSTYKPGACVRDPAAPYYIGNNHVYGAAPRAVLPDPPGAQRRAPKSAPAPGSRGGNLLRWIRAQRAPVRNADLVAAYHGRQPGSVLLNLLAGGHVQKRVVQFVTIKKPVNEYLAAGRPWPALPAGAVIVERPEDDDAC